MQIQKGYKQLVEEAEQNLRAIDSTELNARLQDMGESLLLIDLRDVREVKREGKIPGSLHIPAVCWNSGLIQIALLSNRVR